MKVHFVFGDGPGGLPDFVTFSADIESEEGKIRMYLLYGRPSAFPLLPDLGLCQVK